MRHLTRCVLATALAVVCVPCLAADSPFDGTWKLNPAKSKLSGESYTVSMKADGMFHFSAGGAIMYDYACDGKPYPAMADRTISCTTSADGVTDYTFKIGDRTLRTMHEVIAADGKTLVETHVSYRPDGSSSTGESTYVRTAGTTGPVGTWKDVKAESTNASVMKIKVSGASMHVEEPSYSESYDAKLDGTPATVSGPTVPKGAAMALTKESGTKLRYKEMLNGTLLVEGTQAVSADGMVLTEEEWIPGRESEKAVLVYEKQS